MPPIVDFHNHFMGPQWALTTVANAAPDARARWQRINTRLENEASLLASIESAGIAARVINTPTAFIEDADGNVPADAFRRMNDQMAALCAKHPAKLYALATVDAFSGDAGARELTRAVRDLKLRGVFVESANHDAKRSLLIGAPETRPVLAAAAALGVPVFVHPQTDPALNRRFAGTGPIGVRLARGTVNAAALVNMLETGTFDEIPALRVVVTTYAIGGVLLAGGFGDGARIRRDAPALARRHIYIDTMGLHPSLLRTAVDMLGADHVLMGTDWPVVEEASVPERLATAFAHAGLSTSERQMVAGGNALRLLGAA